MDHLPAMDWVGIGLICGAFVWNIRLEGLALRLKEDVKRHEEDIKAQRTKHDDVLLALGDVKTALARIEGKLGVANG